MPTIIEQFGSEYEDCGKISAERVNAYVEGHLDEDKPQDLIIDSSWETSTIDLTDAVKAAETVTSLYLTPTTNPDTLAFDREDGGMDCIHGDRLSRIISMTKLKDVDQDTEIADGDVYMYDSTTNTFKPYNLKSTVQTINNRLDVIDGRITSLNTLITNLTTVVNEIVEKLTPPEGAPNDVKVAFGNINLYSDNTNASSRQSGLYTHSLNSTIANDEYFS